MSRPEDGDGQQRWRIVDRMGLRRRHRVAVMEAEVRLLERELARFGVLSEEELARRVHATLWHEGTFDEALMAAVACGGITLLPGGFVALRRRRFPVRRRRTGRGTTHPDGDDGA
jgi:hypothetical protein